MYSNDLEACGMKGCYFLFHSEVNFLCVHCSQESDSGLLGFLLMLPLCILNLFLMLLHNICYMLCWIGYKQQGTVTGKHE